MTFSTYAVSSRPFYAAESFPTWTTFEFPGVMYQGLSKVRISVHSLSPSLNRWGLWHRHPKS